MAEGVQHARTVVLLSLRFVGADGVEASFVLEEVFGETFGGGRGGYSAGSRGPLLRVEGLMSVRNLLKFDFGGGGVAFILDLLVECGGWVSKIMFSFDFAFGY